MKSNGLQQKLLGAFSTTTVARGRKYYHLGAVTQVRFGEGRVTAKVVGSRRYFTAIGWTSGVTNRAILINCSCPDFAQGNPCKHLWALVLTIDQKKLVQADKFDNHLDLHRMDADFFIKPGQAKTTHSHAPQVLSPKSSAQNLASWREAAKGIQQSNRPRRQIASQVHQALIMEPDLHDEEWVKFGFVTAQVNSQGAMQVTQQPVVSRFAALAGAGTAVHAAHQILEMLAKDSEYHSMSSYSAYRTYRDPRFLRLRATSLPVVMPGLFELIPVYANSQDFYESVTSQSKFHLEVCWFHSLLFIVVEHGSGFLLTGKITVLTAPQKKIEHYELSEVKQWGLLNLYQIKRFVGFWNPTALEQYWMDRLSRHGIPVAVDDTEPFLEMLLNQEIPFELPPGLQLLEELIKPGVKLRLVSKKTHPGDPATFSLELLFAYGKRSVGFTEKLQKLVSIEDSKVFLRNFAEETKVFDQLPEQIIRSRNGEGEEEFKVAGKNVVEFVTQVLASGLEIEVDCKRVHTFADSRLEVSSGVDWFELKGEVECSSMWVKFPNVLSAITKGEKFVPLPNGAVGLLNESLQKKLTRLAEFAKVSDSGLRFDRQQALLLNALLEDNKDCSCDEVFTNLRKNLKKFNGLKKATPVRSFKGKLRDYQKIGLGWLQFLETFGLGGILADDMGLGKTVQCLAFLEGRRTSNKDAPKPSLLLAPKSLIFNWQSEANRFAPELRVVILSGSDRESNPSHFRNFDLVITTYQTMLRDQDCLGAMKWDCVILDEAQAIKNPDALVARAAKSLQARFRLAMTGTPIENSIKDLFSISDFVNPGFLQGKARVTSLRLDEDTRQLLPRAFKPVILRRTKPQVLKELPPKSEQVIVVELEAKQLKVYNELKRYYKHQLLPMVNSQGVKKTGIQILAALTRLRQAALHPRLIDEHQKNSKSAKFSAVLEMLEEAIAEGHRVLVFSQFTQLLGLLQQELNKNNIAFCYLDGQTSRRGQVVANFKTGDCPVFLMSLKAGGVGLNLVEADYVFLLDPWWNPAAESQAIDRAHRIGQTRAVHAYRFIAKGTVEEKILELQLAKRKLASEVLDDGIGLLHNITTQDLAHLLE